MKRRRLRLYSCAVPCVFAWVVTGLFILPGSSFAKPPTKTIAVKIFVDEEEPRTRAYYEQVLGSRLDKASTILSQYGSIRFAVTHFGTWTSNDANHTFAKSLKEFELATNPHPAELAIGFSSQYKLKRGTSNLGGTRGPLRRHILIREGSPNTQETERLEVLTHELAHYLGAAHSGSMNSVMRPVLGDHQSRARAFRIQLDPDNAEVVRIISDEMARFHIHSLHQLTLPSKAGIREQYRRLAKSFATDEVAKRYVMLMDKSIQRSIAQRQRTLQTRRGATSPKVGNNNSDLSPITKSNPTPRQSSPPSALAPPR